MKVSWRAGDFRGEADFKGGAASAPAELEKEMKEIGVAFMEGLIRGVYAKIQGEIAAADRQN